MRPFPIGAATYAAPAKLLSQLAAAMAANKLDEPEVRVAKEACIWFDIEDSTWVCISMFFTFVTLSFVPRFLF
jgi:hypothetical protein